jgi:plastocyanin
MVKVILLSKLSSSLLFFFAAALLFTATPFIAMAETFKVSVNDEGFSPSGLDDAETVTIIVGDTVVWTLKSANSHNIEDGDFEGHTCSGEGLSHTFTVRGEKYSHTFNSPVECYYKCNVHPPDMHGLIRVTGGEGTSTGTAKEKCNKDKDKDCKD